MLCSITANALPLGAVGAKQAKSLTNKIIIMTQNNNQINPDAQSLQMAVMMRNFMQSSSHIVNIEGGRTAYINGYFEFKSYFKKSKSTYYRWIRELEKIDNDFWLDRRCSGLLFYYAS